MKKIAKSNLPELLAAMATRGKVYCPQPDGAGGSKFAPWTPGTPVAQGCNTRLGPKGLFFPQTEELVRFRVSGKKLEIREAELREESFVVFGVRACDCRALEILDRVFLSEPVDGFYKDRRDHGVVVTLACSQPEETCFCGTFGIDLTNPQGDVTAWEAEDCLWFRANTEKGRELLERLPLEDGEDAAVERAREEAREIAGRLPLHGLTTKGFEMGKMLELFRRPEWAGLSESCLGCGTCTFVCPTCQCYDVKEFDNGREVCRFRCWDSCMYSDFTMMAHGTNRPTQLERFRQRFMHKLQYFPDNNEGIYGCVGCGRCLRQCPIHMNIVKVMKTLGGGEDA